MTRAAGFGGGCVCGPRILGCRGNDAGRSILGRVRDMVILNKYSAARGFWRFWEMTRAAGFCGRVGDMVI